MRNKAGKKRRCPVCGRFVKIKHFGRPAKYDTEKCSLLGWRMEKAAKEGRLYFRRAAVKKK